nr:MAG TPA: hypothetical protein [Riboviria sp.]
MTAVMDADDQLLRYFAPQPVVGRRSGLALRFWLAPLVFSCLLCFLLWRVCNPWCCWEIRVEYFGTWLFDLGQYLPGCARRSCAACDWAWVATAICGAVVVFAAVAYSVRPARYGRSTGVVELDPAAARTRIDTWYCPAELAAFVHERVYMVNRDAATLLRLKQAVTRWMDDRQVPWHLRPSWMAGALAAALVHSNEEVNLIRLAGAQRGTADARDLQVWHKSCE